MRCDLTCIKCGWMKCDLSRMKCTDTSNQRVAGGSRFFGHVLWLSIVAWAFSVVSVGACTFVRSGLEGAAYSDLNEWGLFSYNLSSDERQCVSYSNTVNYSSAAKASRAFGVVCCILTGFVMMQAVSLQLFLQYEREFVWRSARILAIAAPLAQLLTFTAFADDACLEPNVKCVPGAAGIIAIFNVFAVLALASVCCIATPPSHPTYEIKRLEVPPVSNEKSATVEDIESGGHLNDDEQDKAIYSYSPRVERTESEDTEAQPEQAPAPNFKHSEGRSPTVFSSSKRRDDSSPEKLDAIVESVDGDIEYPIVQSVRPISPDSEKRRLSFSPRHSKGKLEV